MQKWQNTKICVGGAKKSDHASRFITQLQWLKVKDKIVFDVAVTVFKVINNMFPGWFLQLPTVSDALRNRDTRQRNKLNVPHTNTDSGDVIVPSLYWDPEYGTLCPPISQILPPYQYL